MKDKSKIILALDVGNLKKAKYFVHKLYPEIKIFKVGLQLFSIGGPEIVKFVQNKGAEVFLDLKFFDIPNTVANAVTAAVQLKVKMLTLHISGGEEMLKIAVKAAKEASRRLKLKKPLLIGVTVLTSKKASPRAVLGLAKKGLHCGLDGVVCSAREATFLRGKIKKNFVIVTPGIRPKDAGASDQKRTATVAEAIKSGSNFLVIGRPILEAADPLRAAKEIIKQ
ncbi:MAG: orotidine-5'-phosphate decarboxylase [Candidatus Omnitrophica bacterium]|nr:orotidine-5'-phosphate decarboxylase [Candidatus Omnitrophota bacterium]